MWVLFYLSLSYVYIIQKNFIKIKCGRVAQIRWQAHYCALYGQTAARKNPYWISNTAYSICANGASVAICYHLTLILCRVCIRVVTKLRYFYFPSVCFRSNMDFPLKINLFAFSSHYLSIGLFHRALLQLIIRFFTLINIYSCESAINYRYPISPIHFAIGASRLNPFIQFILQKPNSRGKKHLHYRP